MKRQQAGSALSREINPLGWSDTWDTLVLEEIVDRLIALTMYHGNQTKTSAKKIPTRVMRNVRDNPVANRKRSGRGMTRDEIDRRMSRTKN